MLKGFKPVVVVLILAGILVWGYAGYADVQDAVGSPGSGSDPLVSKSFVEKYVQDFMKDFEPVSNGEWQVIELAAGKVMVADMGAEFIVRSGKAVVVDSTNNGIPDITTGANVMAGREATLNHLFIVPRSDGRGIKAVNSTWIMYKGPVDIK